MSSGNRVRNWMERRAGSPLLNDFEDGAFAEFGGSPIENRSDGLGRSALLTNDLAQILFGHFQLNHGRVFTHDLMNVDLIGKVDQALGNHFNELHQLTLIC